MQARSLQGWGCWFGQSCGQSCLVWLRRFGQTWFLRSIAADGEQVDELGGDSDRELIVEAMRIILDNCQAITSITAGPRQ